MRRREYLAVAGAGLGGLTTGFAARSGIGSFGDEANDDGDGNDSDDGDDPWADDYEPPLRTVDVTYTRSRETDVVFDTQVVQKEVTETKTARLRLHYTNVGDEEVTLSIQTLPLAIPMARFNDASPGMVGSPGVVLVPVEGVSRSQVEPGCWRPAEDGFPIVSVPPTRLDPHRTASQEYEVWTDPEDDHCLKPGEYRFLGSHAVFTIRIEKPEK